MANSLFPKAGDIRPGQVWVDIELELSGQPDPLDTVVVREIDIFGMVVVRSAAFRDVYGKVPLSPDSFRRKYRLKTEG